MINYQFTSNLKFIIHFSHKLPKVLLRGRDKGEPGSSHAAAEEIMGSFIITLKTINRAEISTRSGIQPAWPHPAASTPAPRGKRSQGGASEGVGGIWPRWWPWKCHGEPSRVLSSGSTAASTAASPRQPPPAPGSSTRGCWFKCTDSGALNAVLSSASHYGEAFNARFVRN